jgi:hypothetical protein
MRLKSGQLLLRIVATCPQFPNLEEAMMELPMRQSLQAQEQQSR